MVDWQVGLMLAAANDHTHIAVYRAVENGFAVMRPDVKGISLGVDPVGRELASGEYYSANGLDLVAMMLIEAAPTLYSRPGDVFGLRCWLDSSRVQFSAGGRVRSYADWPQLVDLIQRAESSGFDAYWMVDHPVRRPGCWTTLAGLAAVTRSIRLGTLVNCVLRCGARRTRARPPAADSACSG